VKTELLEVGQQPGFAGTRDHPRARRERGLDVRLTTEGPADRLLREQAGAIITLGVEVFVHDVIAGGSARRRCRSSCPRQALLEQRRWPGAGG
jgi:hypothetical protein